MNVQSFGYFKNNSIDLDKKGIYVEEAIVFLVEFRNRLNHTTTSEEAIPIFKDAVVELDKYGLLPRGMSVERVQKLITGYYENKNILKLQEKLLQGCLPTSGGGWNYLCLITGEADACRSVGPLGFGFYIFLKSLITLTGSGMDGLGLFLILAMWMLSELKISNFLGILTFGSRGYLSADYPSHGYVYTFGSRGVQIINNTFFGGLFRMFDVVGQWECTGATGFFGIKLIDSDRKTSFFIGSAFRVVLVPD